MTKPIGDCARFQEWRDELRKEGITVRFASEAATGALGKKTSDLFIVFFVGSGFQPKHLTGAIHYFGDDGFQVYYPPNDQTITGDVALLKGAA